MNPESSKPGKQRKAAYDEAMHERQKRLSVHLSKPLKKELGRRSLEARKNDRVKVMRGKYRGTEGKVISANHKSKMIFVDKIIRKKSDGTEKHVPVQPSNLLMIEADRSDEKRLFAAKGKARAKKGASENG